ncbi:MAG: glycine--tRNA ligase subunit alpha, partial [Anaerolineaceae bacterium]|nr:glycine--tRNA ligase subunit alpha [Anaerolineaceae bacterium]
MQTEMNFQSLIMKLQKFWGDQGCLIWQPYYTQVGAGTYNPATSLRVLGPEPWNVAYVEPSIRPDDGRYGENPNRLQQFYQFQVILKPDPGNPVEMYLNSLKAIGIKPEEHDIRFVEDNWNSPALGAWGLGWEVWLDGQEITQFTYFQQAGSMPSDPVAVEITYGLERISIPIQRVRSFRDIQWSKDRTYGDVNLMGEREHSTYYFDIADVDRVRHMYDLFEAEAENCLEHGLVLPAHDNVLKCSHSFNILDSRGAVGVTERQALFSRMRDLSSRVAKAYLEQRESMDFPWSKEKSPPQEIEIQKPEPITGSADFVFEIGTEELPVLDLKSALQQVEKKAKTLLSNLRLKYDALEIMGTPRRIVVSIKELAGHQPDQTTLVKGPPAKIAFDQDGNPTKAAIGFARGKKIPVESLEVKEIDGGQYAAATINETGQPACEVLPDAFNQLIDSIRFNKSMRWDNTQKTFSRPVRWLFCLHGTAVIPVKYGNLTAGNITRGLRFTDGEIKLVDNTKQYFQFMEMQGILLSPAKRKETIRKQVQSLLRSVKASANIDEDLLDEVTNLVEVPTAMLGTFDSD